MPVEPGGSPPRVGWRFVEGEYFRAIGIPLRVGRTFDAGVDRTGAPPVAIVNEALARRYFGSAAAALGREIVMRNATSPGSSRTLIVGVVGDVHHESLRAAPLPEVYRPLSQVFMMTMAVVVRTEGSPSALARAAREAVWAIDPNIPVADVQPLDTWLQVSLGRPRLVARLLLVFACTGLALGVIGVYGVAAYRVRRRQREIGVRMALGAAPGQVSALILRQALLQAALGLVVGLPAAWGLSRLLQHQLFEVQPGDPLTFAALPALVVIVALLACAIPARRAMRIDPVSAIRED
jgi:putative ABC transport system permease protein